MDGTETTNQLTLLFVDDEASVLSSLKRVCRGTGWNILIAESGEKGLEILQSEAIDLIVSDMRMPEMDGAEFLEKAAELSPQTVRILLTGYSDMESTIAAINQGKIYSYIAKPWDNDELKEILSRALRAKQLELEKERLEQLTHQQNEELKALNGSLEAKVAKRTEQLSQANSKLSEAYRSSVEVFSSLLEVRSEDTSGHGKRVTEISYSIAAKLILEDSVIEQIYFAALLHDIGKLALSDQLMSLGYQHMDRKQQLLYEKHSSIGEAALMGVKYLNEAATYIRQHHEHLDGSGYPDGLIGEDITLGAQIISLASYYDDLVSGVTTGEPMDGVAARAALAEKSGIWFKEELLQILFNLLDDGSLSGTKSADRLLNIEDLEPGMTLSRDVYTPDGPLLLSKGKVLDDDLIEKIMNFQRDRNTLLSLYVIN